MPFILNSSKKHIEAKYNLLVKLEEKCKNCKLLSRRAAKDAYIYSISGDYAIEDGPAMVAIAEYDNNIYAIYAPEYLIEEQFLVIEFLVRDIELTDKIIVFQNKILEVINERSYGKPINVQLYINA